MKNYLYWIYDESCNDPFKDGYVGVSKDYEKRFLTHLRLNSRIPNGAEIKLLFEGKREDCFFFEEYYRPHAGIGWNLAKGGSHGWQINFCHSDETKEKLRNAWSEERKEKASKWKAQHNKELIGQKRPKQSISISGKKNGMYGNTHSDEAKEKISEAHKGKTPWNKGKTFTMDSSRCPHCKLEGRGGNMKRYHFDNCKEYKE